MGLQTEYEWKKERFEALTYYAGFSDKHTDEIVELSNWFNTRKPQWERCTKENTSVGDFVRPSPEMIPGAVSCRREVVFLLDNNDGEFVILYGDDSQEHLRAMRNFEINTNKGAE